MFYIEVFAQAFKWDFFLIVCQFPISSVTTSEYCALRPESRESRRSRSRSRRRRRWAPRWARRPKGFTCLEIERKSDPRLKKKKKNHGFLSFLDCPRCFQSLHFVVLKLRAVFEPFQHSQQQASPGQLTCRQERGRKKCAVKRFWGLTRTQTKLWRMCQLLGSLSLIPSLPVVAS
jgi:transcription elongation factor Elf1